MNLAKGGKAAKTVLARQQRERVFLRLFEQAWNLQTMLGGHIHAENPTGSQAWQEINIGPAFEVNFHMCAVGMVCKESGLPVLKPTRVVTSDAGLVAALHMCRCPGHAKHAHLEGKSKTSEAETYPKPLCQVVAKYLKSRDPDVLVTHDGGDEADSERESDQEGGDAEPEQRPVRQADFRAMVQKLHVNVGHASVPQMLRLAQRAKAPQALISRFHHHTGWQH